MQTNEQLMRRIDVVAKEFKGQIPDLYQMIGVVVIGRLFGWRVVRLTVSRRMWVMVSVAFGDPKEWMEDRGPLAYKSLGLKIVDKLGDYWDFINGVTPRDDISPQKRRTVI